MLTFWILLQSLYLRPMKYKAIFWFNISMWNIYITYYAENMPIIVSSSDQTVVCLVVVTALSTWLCIYTPANEMSIQFH